VADGDVPGGTGAGGNATGGDGDEDVWLDLVARFDAPSPAGEAPPWPDREDLAGPVRVTPSVPPSVPEALPGEPPTNPTGLPGLPVLGGPSMLIGLGGGAASSVGSGQSSSDLDFASVQRGNAEIREAQKHFASYNIAEITHRFVNVRQNELFLVYCRRFCFHCR